MRGSDFSHIWTLASQVSRLALPLLDFAMIAATPVDGSHYFCDVFAGLIVAALSWIAVSYIVTQVDSTHANWLKKRRETVDACQRASPNI